MLITKIAPLMEAHVLSAEEQKHSLSGKRKRKKITVKNVLGTPYENYWPLVNEEEAQQLTQLIRRSFRGFITEKVSVPWSVMKTIPKDQRKAFRSTYIKCSPKTYRSSLAVGVNETTRSIEKRSAVAILISEEVEPKFLVRHIIDACVLHKLPVLVVPNLKVLLKDVLDMPTIAMAFKRDTCDYTTVVEKIKEVSLNYPSPEAHINAVREAKTAAMDVDDDELVTQPPRPTDLYLRRTTSARVFVPRLSQFSADSDCKVDEGGDFLSFESEEPVQITPVIGKERKRPKVSYKSLLLKRVTDDKNRDVRKIVKLKTKTK